MKIIGISAALPENHVTHGSEKRKFTRLTGVHTRYICNDDETFYSLGIKAAKNLFNKLPITPKEVGFCICNSQTNDRFYPNIAFRFSEELKLERNIAAFDMHLGCSALPNVLNVSSALLESKSNHKPYGLIIIGDTLSKQALKDDESTYPLFGDAVTAIIVENSEEPFKFANYWRDEDNPSICVNALGYDKEGSLNVNQVNKIAASNHTIMKGDKVFEFVTKEVFEFLSQENIKGTFDYFAFHQGNKFMNDLLINKLDYDKQKSLESIHLFGNTSCASICMSILGSQDKIDLKGNVKVLTCGFGIGLNAAYTIITLDKDALLEII